MEPSGRSRPSSTGTGAIACRSMRATALPLGTTDRFLHSIRHRKTAGKGIAVIDHDRIEPGHPRPAFDRRNDGVAVADPGAALDAADEGRADDALVHELVAFAQAA